MFLQFYFFNNIRKDLNLKPDVKNAQNYLVNNCIIVEIHGKKWFFC